MNASFNAAQRAHDLAEPDYYWDNGDLLDAMAEEKVPEKVAEMLTDDSFITDGSFTDHYVASQDTNNAMDRLLAQLLQVDIEQLPLEVRQAFINFRDPMIEAMEQTAKAVILGDMS